jgi:hypothetical protein
MTQTIRSATRPVNPKLVQLLQALKPGDRVQITQTVRVGRKIWTTTVAGVFRDLQYLATGLATHRPRAEEIVVPTVHFTKDSGELSSIAIDENTVIERLA